MAADILLIILNSCSTKIERHQEGVGLTSRVDFQEEEVLPDSHAERVVEILHVGMGVDDPLVFHVVEMADFPDSHEGVMAEGEEAIMFITG